VVCAELPSGLDVNAKSTDSGQSSAVSCSLGGPPPTRVVRVAIAVVCVICWW